MWKKIILGLVICPLGGIAYIALVYVLYYTTRFSFLRAPIAPTTPQDWIIYACSFTAVFFIIVFYYASIVRMRIAGIWSGFFLGAMIHIFWRVFAVEALYSLDVIKEPDLRAWWWYTSRFISEVLPFMIVGFIHGADEETREGRV